MIIAVLFAVTMFLWALSSVPHPALVPFSGAWNWLAFVAVLLLGIYLFIPGLRA